MADNPNYIGVAMGMDVSDLKQGLSEANAQIRKANAEFKSATAGMDDWTKSSEGLEAKISQLGTVLDMQKKKLAGLNAEYDEVVKAQGENSEAAKRLYIQIKNQEAVVKKTDKEYKNFKETLEGVEDGSIDLEKTSLRAGKAVEKTGKQAEEAGEGFTIAKGAVAGFIANGLTALVSGAKNAITSLLALSESTREYREDLNKLKTAFQSAGHSTKAATDVYKELYSVFGEEDRAVEAAQQIAALAKDEEEMAQMTEIATGAWAKWGDSLATESLMEGINHTAKLGEVQGTLADALEWCGINVDSFNESLAEKKTEEERSAYILETLNDLYSDSAKIYRQNNASIIRARKETSDYNDTLAELGETLEPVNQEINSLKLELAKEFAPTLKNDVAPALKEFLKELKDTGAITKAGKALAFLIENFDTIARTIVTAIGVWKTLKTVMAISNTVSAASEAIKSYTTAVGAATKAQIALNAAQKANLWGAIASLAVSAISAVATYALTSKNASKDTDLLTESQRKAVTKAKELAEAYKETKKEAANLAAQELSNLDYTENLWKELQKLADKNGVVKKGYEDRANFILNELNKALGTEYTMNGNIISQYGDMKKGIEEVILAKRAQILLTAHEKSYKEAVENVAAAEKARAIQVQELAAQEEAVRLKQIEVENMAKAAREATSQQSQMDLQMRLQSLYNELEAEKSTLAEKQTAYNESEATLFGYYSDIDTYQKASTLIMQGETAKAVQYLEELATNFKTVANTAKLGADEQKKVLEQQVIDTEINARLMKQAYEDGVEGVTEEMVTTAKEQADKAKTEFKKVGGNITEGIAEGSDEKTWTLETAMENVINAGLKAAKAAAGIQSPSRLFRDEIGKYIGEGVGVGVLDSIPIVKKDVQKFNDFLTENVGINGSVADLSANISTSGGSIRRASGSVSTGGGISTTSKSTVINAGMTVNYNGKLSRKEIKRLENDNYIAVRTRLKAEGAI